MDFEQDWQTLYQLAALETNWLAMEGRITAAEFAIRQRLIEMSQDHGGTAHENQSIIATTQKLTVLRGELALWKDSESVRRSVP